MSGKSDEPLPPPAGKRHESDSQLRADEKSQLPEALIYDPGEDSPVETPADRSRRTTNLGAATPPAPPEARAPFDRIAHFKIVNKIGEGGMGVVYHAMDEYLQRLVALKVLGTGGDAAIDVENTQRLLREARAASRINHPNVVTVYAAGEYEGHAFIAMEYVEGRELTDLIGTGGLDTERALGICAQIAEGLAAAHDQGIVHRDIKPANILVCANDRVKILDFGLAKPGRIATEGDAVEKASTSRLPAALANADDGLNVYQTQAGIIWGSLHYMSPEQACGDPLDPRSDIFSLGVVLYQMLVGRLPFYGKKPMEQLASMMNDTPPALRTFRMRIPDSVQAVVDRALEKNRDFRYSNARTMASEIQTVLTRLKDFGDMEFEVAGHKVQAPVAVQPTAAPAQNTVKNVVTPQGVRYDRSIPGQTLAFYPKGSEFDLVIHSHTMFDWTTRSTGPLGSGGVQGTAVSVRGDVYELAVIDTKSTNTIRYSFRLWPDTMVLRRVVDFTPEYVAECTRQIPARSNTIGGVIANFFGKRKE